MPATGVARRPSTRSTPRSRSYAAWRPRCCRSSPRRSGAGSPAAARCTSRTGPTPSDLPADHALVAAMDRAREVCSTAPRCARPRGLRVRLPLSDLTVVVDECRVAARPSAAIIADEVNVSTVTLRDVTEASQADFGIIAEAHRQRPRRRPAAGAGRAAGHQGQQDRRLVGGGRRHRDGGRSGPAGGRVHPRDRRRRGGSRRVPRDGDAAGRRVRRARHRGHARAGPGGRWPATSSARCSRRGATPASTSATASASP